MALVVKNQSANAGGRLKEQPPPGYLSPFPKAEGKNSNGSHEMALKTLLSHSIPHFLWEHIWPKNVTNQAWVSGLGKCHLTGRLVQ